MYHLGIIGVGNMGEAILRGVLAGHAVDASHVSIFDTSVEKREALAHELGVAAATTLTELVGKSDMILLAIKPNVVSTLLDQQRGLFYGKAIISIVAGWSGERLADNLPKDARILRVMPNTPAMVGAGMIVFEAGDTLSEQEYAFATELFSAIGRIETVSGKLMDAVTGVSGSGPAYVYLFIEAMADAGVQQGLPRTIAYDLAAQTVLGAARMVLETGEHPGELKDRVCSPGGTTIDAVVALEKYGFRNAVIEAVAACTIKSQKMSENI